MSEVPEAVWDAPQLRQALLLALAAIPKLFDAGDFDQCSQVLTIFAAALRARADRDLAMLDKAAGAILEWREARKP
jgi:hypothetical protein